jgi:hypothetical protein
MSICAPDDLDMAACFRVADQASLPALSESIPDYREPSQAILELQQHGVEASVIDLLIRWVCADSPDAAARVQLLKEFAAKVAHAAGDPARLIAECRAFCELAMRDDPDLHQRAQRPLAEWEAEVTA